MSYEKLEEVYNDDDDDEEDNDGPGEDDKKRWKRLERMIYQENKEINPSDEASERTSIRSKKYRCSDEYYRESVQLPRLQLNEQLFFDLVEDGDVEAVKEFLQEGANIFNINCTNFKGLTALHIAIENNNEDIVNFLLQQSKVDVTDCALHAIRKNQPNILIKILDILKEASPELEFTGCIYSPDFSMNITPLILAAQCGNYEIVDILLERGHSIPKPHKPCCFCPDECMKILQTEDLLLITNAILDIYRALASPVYICQVSSDPILYSFELCEELKSYASFHTIFKKDFLKIARDVEIFAADLLACCRSCEEVTTILSQNEGCHIRGHLLFPRLILAMNYKQKEFVAKTSVQQVLENACIGDWYRWKCYHIVTKVLFIFPRMLSLPYVFMVCFFAPHSKKAQYYSLPINRMLTHVASYVIFLFLLFLQSNKDKTDQRKEIELTGLEIPIALFVIGNTWKEFRLCILQGPKQFFRFEWNTFKVILEIVFVLHYVFFISAYLTVMSLPEEEKQLERKYWHYLDPQLIAEALFAIGTIMSYFKILLLIQVQEAIGPLQVSLGKMLYDCLRYASLFCIVITGFTVGLGKLYNYYSGMTQTDPESGDKIRQGTPFTNPLDTLKYLFWGLLALSDPDYVNVVIEDIPGEGDKTVITEHYITEALGYYAFATYMVLTVIIVLNMMIATMANTFQKVIDNVDVEWVFGRTEVYLGYTQQSVLPPPLNLIPTLMGVKQCRNWFQFLKAGSQPGDEDDKKPKKNLEPDSDYSKLMTLLVQRYFNRQDRQQIGLQKLTTDTKKRVSVSV